MSLWSSRNVDRLARSATLHCLTGCAIGEVLGMVVGTSLGWSNAPTIALSIVLAFVFGYALTIRPLRAAGLPLARAVRLALASDTLSISVMEVVDNAIMLAVPGAMNAELTQPLFWVSLIVSLSIAGVSAYPVNRWLIVRGRGHALVHDVHEGTEHRGHH
jgi:uncharacterized protein DUF4396